MAKTPLPPPISASDVTTHAPSRAASCKLDTGRQYTVIRDVVYDITDFIGKHPGSSSMAKLAVGRDATALFECHHIREKVAAAYLNRLPKPSCTPSELAKLVPFDTPFPTPEQHGAGGGIVDPSGRTLPLPGDSELYTIIKERVRNEVLAPRGKVFVRGGMWQWSETAFFWSFFFCTSYWFVISPSVLTGTALAVGGYFMAAYGHMAGHGAMTESTLLGEILALSMDLIGGSAWILRYLHNISHHLYTNDKDLDLDCYKAFPIIRLHASQPRSWYHRFQWLYAMPAYSFAFLFLALGMIKTMADGHIHHLMLLGTTSNDIVIFLFVKLLQVFVFILLPSYMHGSWWVTVYYIYSTMLMGFIATSTFLVNHTLEEAMPQGGMAGDWAEWQIATAVSYGDRWTTFLQGGGNFQIEHHLFPAMPANMLPDVAPIVKEECAKRGLRYNGYDSFLGVVVPTFKYLYDMGRVEKQE